MKKLVLASVCTLALVGFVMADEFAATITKVDGNTVYYYKGGKKGTDKTEGKATAAAKVKVAKGVFDKDTKKTTAGEDIADGLKNEMFTKIDAEKGVGVTLITDDKSGNITQILTKGGKGAGGGKGGKKKG